MIQRIIAAALTAALLGTTGNGAPSAPATTVIHLHPVGASRTWGTATISAFAFKLRTAGLSLSVYGKGSRWTLYSVAACGNAP